MKIAFNISPAMAGVDGADANKSPAAAPAGATLPDPLESMAMSDDVIAQITALLAKGYREDRKEAKKLAHIEQKLHAAEVRRRVAELHKRADATLSAAVVGGITQMVSGTAQLASATAPLWTNCSGTSKLSEEMQVRAQWRAEDLASGVLQGGGKVTAGAGELGAGVYRADAQHAESRAAQHEGNAEAAKRRASEYRDEGEDAKRMLQKVAEFLRETRASQQNAANAALYKA